MDENGETLKEEKSQIKKGFIKTVFNFDDENKADMMNIVQYTLLAVIPCLLILKVIKSFSPDADNSKGSIEIFIEIVIQLTIMVLALYFINKIIRYIPTLSKFPYLGDSNITGFLLPLVFLLLTMQTKLGHKVNILLERVVDTWNGNQDAKKPSKEDIKVKQPLAGNHQASRADVLDQSQLLPSDNSSTQMPNTIAPQGNPNFNAMYQNQTTPMPDAASPAAEPMAANEGFGGFSSW